jgi:hypothetical protein
MIEAAISAIVMLTKIGETITGLKFCVDWLDEHFGGLLPCDLVASVLDRRVRVGDRRDRRQPDPNVGRYRVSDRCSCPTVFRAAA